MLKVCAFNIIIHKNFLFEPIVKTNTFNDNMFNVSSKLMLKSSHNHVKCDFYDCAQKKLSLHYFSLGHTDLSMDKKVLPKIDIENDFLLLPV